jgi:hypothetical protein
MPKTQIPPDEDIFEEELEEDDFYDEELEE